MDELWSVVMETILVCGQYGLVQMSFLFLFPSSFRVVVDEVCLCLALQECPFFSLLFDTSMSRLNFAPE